jgi:sarcosine oxidase subunit gamma
MDKNERAPQPTDIDPTSPFQVTALGARTVLWLKSWLPDYERDEKTVQLAHQALPLQVGATGYRPLHTLCIGPGNWLITASAQPASSLCEALEPDLSRYGLAIVDLSDGLATLNVQGTCAREILSKGCGLDFHRRYFPVGLCARTRIAKVHVVIECLDGPQRFELTVARSYSRYLLGWLHDSAREFRTPFLTRFEGN